MQFAERDRRQREGGPDRLGKAFLRAAVLAPGGLVAGYLLGRVLGRLVGGCALTSACDDAGPVLLTIPTSIVGMGTGSILAATRVSRWWEGIAVLGVGLVSALGLVVLIGWSGADSLAGRMLALGWLVAAVGMALLTRWPSLYDEG